MPSRDQARCAKVSSQTGRYRHATHPRTGRRVRRSDHLVGCVRVSRFVAFAHTGPVPRESGWRRASLDGGDDRPSFPAISSSYNPHLPDGHLPELPSPKQTEQARTLLGYFGDQLRDGQRRHRGEGIRRAGRMRDLPAGFSRVSCRTARSLTVVMTNSTCQVSRVSRRGNRLPRPRQKLSNAESARTRAHDRTSATAWI